MIWMILISLLLLIVVAWIAYGGKITLPSSEGVIPKNEELRKKLGTLMVFIAMDVIVCFLFKTLLPTGFKIWYGKFFWLSQLIMIVGFLLIIFGYKNYFKYVFILALFPLIGSFVNFEEKIREVTELKTEIIKNEDQTVTVRIHPSSQDFERIKFPYGKGTGDRALKFGFRNVIVKTRNGFEKTIHSEAISDVLGTNLQGPDKFLSAKSLTPTDSCYVWIRYDPKENPQGYTWK